MTTSSEWDDIKYKLFSTGLMNSRRFSVPQNASEDFDVLEAIRLYQSSKLKLQSLGKLATRKDQEEHLSTVHNVGNVLLDKNIHKRRY